LNQISESWQLLTTTFGDLTHSTQNENVLQNANILSSLDHLFNHELDQSFIDWYFDEIGQYLKEEIVEPFRNKSKNILALHHRQMLENKVLSKENANKRHQKIQFMNFDNFDVKLWANFLHEISNIIEEVYCEIFKIENNITQLATLLNALYSKRNPSFFLDATASNHTLSELSTRLSILIDTLFLMDGGQEFETIFRIMFEYAFVYFSKTSNHQSDALVIEFNKICTKLHTLRWLKILQSVFINVAYDNIQYELHRNYESRKGNHFIDYTLFEQPLLHQFKTWVNQIVIAWLKQIIVQNPRRKNTQNKNSNNGSALNVDFADLVQKIDYFVYEKFGEMRTREMFDIILIYPQSIAALNDLKQCLNVTSEWRTLQISMLSSFKKRLLHHGASSKDIITQYIATIGALKQLDPTGITLEIIGEPMRIYLRERDDAIRCVVAHLMETDSGLLREFQEKSLKKQAGNASLVDHNNDDHTGNDDGNESEDSVDSDLDGVHDAKQWEPDPLDSMIAKSSIFKRNSDTIGLLVKIFGSKEIFVEEYRKLLGDRLLSRQSDFFNIDKEMEYLELMKLRFGDDSMADCQVMVKDIINSQRDTCNIQPIISGKLLRQNPNSNSNTICEQMSKSLDATIISSQYWPQTTNNNEAEKLDKDLPYKLPNAMQTLYACFEETYAEIKKPRQIYWLAQHGCVDLEIELNSHVVKLKTKPLHAALLMIVQEYFDEMKMHRNDDALNDEYKANMSYMSCQQLYDRIGMDEEELMAPLSFWMKRAIIKRVYDAKSTHQLIGYRIADGKQEEMHALNCLKRKLNQKSNAHLIDVDDDEDDDDVLNMNNNNEERENIAADFERTVLGVLTAFQGSTIERILTRVKQMQLHPLYAKITLHQLQNVLDKLTNEKRVIFQDGEYKRSR